MRRAVAIAALAVLLSGAEAAPVDYRSDARAVDALIAANYAYLDRFVGSVIPDSPELRKRRDAVRDRASLLRYAEDRLASLADDHAITGSSADDSWAVVPSFSDLWVERIGGAYRVTAVRDNSPGASAGIIAGDEVVSVGGEAIEVAVAGWWRVSGLAVSNERAGHAARVLAAGRRDRSRVLGIARSGVTRFITLPSLYAVTRTENAVSVTQIRGGGASIRLGDSLGDRGMIVAFDAAMAGLLPGAAVTLDLRNTPGGGNTTVARAIMGWFAAQATGYQVHDRPVEERETGIARRWTEQVLPRVGKRHRGPVTVRVGRWTGSMGEGLAIGMRALGATVCGGPMAGLRGSIEDFRLPASGLVIKLPTERLSTVDGTPREAFVPERLCPGERPR